MSVLFWLFGLGAAAVAFPVLFHLIRQQPQGQTDFSSLMFLKPTPPRISRKSRIENWLLLLLRCLAIFLIAAAFMRPFIPDSARLVDTATVHRRIAILVDTSASMQRHDTWQQTKSKIESYLDDLESTDQVGLFAFDNSVTTLVPFQEMTSSDTADDNRQQLRDALTGLGPSWNAGNLAAALSSTARQLVAENESNAVDQGLAQLQILLVSDMQEPMDWNQMQTFQWPESVKLDLLPIQESEDNDAQLFELKNQQTADANKLRITNDAAAQKVGFSVSWSPLQLDETATTSKTDSSIDIQVSSGSGQSISIPEGFSQGAGVYHLAGDDDTFGNQWYAVNPISKLTPVICLSDDQADDPNRSLYFFKIALPETFLNRFQIQRFPTGNSQWIDLMLDTTSSGSPTTILVNRKLASEEAAALQQAVLQGTRCVLIVDADQDPAVLEMAGVTKASQLKQENGKYLLLSDLNFDHPILRPFRESGFNDFTKIRFWNARKCDLLEVPGSNPTDEVGISSNYQIRRIAKFDNGIPAIWEYQAPNSRGSVIAFSFDWNAEDNQLVLSSKFVPLVQELVLPTSRKIRKLNFWTGQRITVADIAGTSSTLRANSNSATSPESENLQVAKPADEIETARDNLDQLASSAVAPDQVVRIDEFGQFPVELRRLSEVGEKRDKSPSSEAGQVDSQRDIYFVPDAPGVYAVESAGSLTQMIAVNINPTEFLPQRLDESSFSAAGASVGQVPTVRKQQEINRKRKDVELEESQKVWKWLIATALIFLIAEMWVAGNSLPASTQLAGGEQ